MWKGALTWELFNLKGTNMLWYSLQRGGRVRQAFLEGMMSGKISIAQMRQEKDIKDVLGKINNVAGNWPLPERSVIIISKVQHPCGENSFPLWCYGASLCWFLFIENALWHTQTLFFYFHPPSSDISLRYVPFFLLYSCRQVNLLSSLFNWCSKAVLTGFSFSFYV